MNTTFNPLSLLGASLEVSTSAGYAIEAAFGIEKNPFSKADLGFWELKSRRSDAKAWMTLGSKASQKESELLEQVFEKIQNVIFFEYESVSPTEIRIVKITFMWGLSKEDYLDNYGKLFKKEVRSDTITLKANPNKIHKMYKGRVIEYKI